MKHTVVVEHHFIFRKKNMGCNREKGPRQMNEGLKKLKQLWNDKPAEFIVVMSAAAVAAVKVIDAVSAAQGRRAYAQQVQLSKIKAGL